MMNRTTVFSTAWIWLWSFLAMWVFHVLNVMYHKSTCLFDWTFFIMNTPINITVMADTVGMVFSATVLFISANVLMFSTVYMSEEKFKDRFTILVLLFVLSMNLLIFIPHFIVLLLGWDGLGIVSFALVIYYQNPKSLAAGMITALTNRIGDVFILMSIALTLNQGHWMITNMWVTDVSSIQIMFIMAAAMTKSAQMPFSSWLPAAMAAPTPVSALVHSSTLVTAGVFLLIRFYSFLHTLPMFNTCLLVIAVSTMFMAGMSATTECDAKKIIALSTLSQLGMMMTSLGFNLPHLAFFHMITHALFKALLFVCAGSFINSNLHTQDLRWMGNLTPQMPVASSCITLANLALCGFPFMAGFYSKDMIMEAAMFSPNNMIMLILCMLSLGFTAFYSIRFSITTMWSPHQISPYSAIKEDKNVVYPMLFLAVMSITMGALMSWFNPVSSSLYLIPSMLKLMPLMLVTAGLLLGWIISMKSITTSNMLSWNMFNVASCSMWFLVPLSSQYMLSPSLKSAHYMSLTIDNGWLEQFSGMNMSKILVKSNNYMTAYTPKLPSMYILTSMLMFSMLLMLT